jgi:PAS domain-containing protein
MITCFAPAERAAAEVLREETACVSRHPITGALLKSASGLLAILNEQRQILAANHSFLEALGLPDLSAVLGLRPGEAFGCAHARDQEGGCGTGGYCGSCGAAIALVIALTHNRPEERRFLLSVRRPGGPVVDLCLRVRCCPLTLVGRRFLLLFLQDITASQHCAELERFVARDVARVAGALENVSRAEAGADPAQLRQVIAGLHELARRLACESAIQKVLTGADLDACQPNLQEVPVRQLLGEISDFAGQLNAARKKPFLLDGAGLEATLRTDKALLERVLTHMLANAFEASEEDDPVRLRVGETAAGITFAVWSRPAMTASVAERVFHRYFTTKPEPGRGQGTYVMKLLGERLLGGQVSFTSSESEGTEFLLSLPRTAAGA